MQCSKFMFYLFVILRARLLKLETAKQGRAYDRRIIGESLDRAALTLKMPKVNLIRGFRREKYFLIGPCNKTSVSKSG